MFILRRYDLNPNLSYLFSSYSEVTNSRKTFFNGKEAATLFLENENSAKRAILLGWIDETKEYNKELEKELEKTKQPKKRGRKPKKTTK